MIDTIVGFLFLLGTRKNPSTTELFAIFVDFRPMFCRADFLYFMACVSDADGKCNSGGEIVQ